MTIGRLHVITDMTLQQSLTHSELAAMALEGGADVVQYREKAVCTTRAHLRHARSMVDISSRWAGNIVINDRADIAVGASAWGLHIGAHDLEPELARQLIGPHAILGATANNLDQARALAEAPINYLGVGPVFPTSSKSHPAPVLGIEGIEAIASQTPHPVIAIGSIEPKHVAPLLSAGAFGIAVLSGVCSAADPKEATQAYRAAIDACLKSEARSAS